MPLREFAGLISKHFTDMEMVDTRKDKKPYVGLHSILGNVTLGGKSSDATPNLPDAVVRSNISRVAVSGFSLSSMYSSHTCRTIRQYSACCYHQGISQQTKRK